METPMFSDLPSDEWSERGDANKTVIEMGGRRLTLRRVQLGKDGGSGRKLLLGNICGTEMGWRIQ